MSRLVRFLSIFGGGGGLRAGLDRGLFVAGAVTPERAVPHDRRHLVGRKLGHRQRRVWVAGRPQDIQPENQIAAPYARPYVTGVFADSAVADGDEAEQFRDLGATAAAAG